MLLDSYKEFKLTDRVMVKKEVIHNFLIANLSSGGKFYMPVIDYIIRKKNELTIAKIEFDATLLIQAHFSFNECDGQLYYGQFIKCFPVFFIMNHAEFKE